VGDDKDSGVGIRSWIGKDEIPFITSQPMREEIPLSHKLVTGDLEKRGWGKTDK
jgi:hypothetical protein